jgi:hypothetical protein
VLFSEPPVETLGQWLGAWWSLRRAVDQYMEHYLFERNHQGLKNSLVRRTRTVATNDGEVHRRPRLGGMLNFYYRAAG